MTDLRKLLDEAARRTCQEKCAMYGEPPCWLGSDGVWPNHECDEPGCDALAKACAEPIAAALLKAEEALAFSQSVLATVTDEEANRSASGLSIQTTWANCVAAEVKSRATLTEIRKLTGAA